MNLPNFGLIVQKKLFESKVLVIGAGGLGCPALLYLAAAGIGNIGLVDDDIIDLSNLPRQILYSHEDIGQLKVEKAIQKLSLSFPDTRFESHVTRLKEENSELIIAGYDIVLDGTDNFQSRYLINDTCLKLGKPLVYGSVSRFEGQVSVFNYPDENGVLVNYRHLFPEMPDENTIKNCSDAGVLGVTTGIIGTLQANEVIKLISGLGIPLANKLLSYHSQKNIFYETQIINNQDSLEVAGLDQLRNSLNEIDKQIVFLLAKRQALIHKIGLTKQELNLPILQEKVWEKSIENRIKESEYYQLNREFIVDVFNRIHQESIHIQEEKNGKN